MSYEFTGETCEFQGVTLQQIRAIRDLPKHGVMAGAIGGWIENESNLPSDSLGWIFAGARALGSAVVHGGVMWGGEMHGGEMHGGVMWGGVMWGGEMRGGVMWGGVMWGGVMRGGEMHGGVMSRDPIYIAGLRWPILINDDQMTIGCQSHSLTKWWQASDALIAKMDPEALGFWREHKATILALCKATGRPVPAEAESVA